MKRSRRLVPLLLPFLLVPGCLDFDEQDVTIAYDAGRDRLNLLLVYRGLFGVPNRLALDAGPDATALGRTEEQLDRLLKGERWFALFGNFPFAFNIDRMERAEKEWEKRAAAYASRSVTVENGRAFRDAAGRLCAWQCVRIERFGELVAIANDAFAEELADEEERAAFLKSLVLEDEASRAALDRALAERRPFVERRGGALVFRIPASAAGHRAVVARLLREFVKEARHGEPASTPPSASDRPTSRAAEVSEFERSVGLLSSAEISLIRTGDWTEFVLGNPERAEQTLHMPRGGKYRENLAPLLAERKVTIHADVTEETIRAAFEKFVRS